MSGNNNSLGRNLRMTGAGILILAGVAGCAEEDIGPQFANNPPTATAGTGVGLPTAAAATPEVAATPVAFATPVTVQEVLGTRGGVQRVLLASNQTIWAVDDSGESESLFDAEPDEQILAIGPSPDATQVAAVLAWDDGRESSLVILNANGELLNEVELPSQASAESATPVASTLVSSSVAVDWSPQGDRILLLQGDNSLMTIGVEPGASLEQADLDDVTGNILEPVWSPTGQQIAFLLVDPASRTRSLVVHDLQSGETNELLGARDDRLVVEFAWEPGGQEILFTEGSALGGSTSGIDLWRIGSDGEGRELVAAAGTAAPVARIANVTPSPNGKSVAYAVLVPGEVAPVVDSIWVRDLSSGQGFRLGLPSIRSVENIWWTSKGLAVASVTDRRNEPVLAVLLVAPNGTVSALWATPLSSSTPGATPVAAPDSDEDEG